MQRVTKSVGLATSLVWVAGLAPSVAAGAPALHWSTPRLADAAVVSAVACSSPALCVAVGRDGFAATSTATGGWRGDTTRNRGDLAGVSCPSPALCVAVGEAGVSVSTDPSGGAATWRVAADPEGSLTGVSCASISLCVAVDGVGDIVSSSNPARGSSWTGVVLSPSLPSVPVSISCVPGASFCVAVGPGVIATSSDPTGGKSAWSVTSAHPDLGLNEVSCPSVSLCVAAGGLGTVLVSNNPDSAAATWTPEDVDGTHQLAGLSCPSSSLCVAVDDAGNVISASDPASGPWTVSPADTAAFTALACPTVALCVAGDVQGRIASTSEPQSPSLWALVGPLEGTPLSGLSCPSASLCVGVDNVGNAVATPNPEDGNLPWTRSAAAPGGTLQGVSCLPAGQCIAVGSNTSNPNAEGAAYVAATNDPLAASPSWTGTQIPLFNRELSPGLTAVSCASASLCLASSDDVAVERSRNPLLGSWTEVDVGNPAVDLSSFLGISCPSPSLCAAVDTGIGKVAFSRRPAEGRQTWHFIKLIKPGRRLDAISCPTTSFCVVVDAAGDVISSTHPTAGPGAWQRANLGRHDLTSVSCAGRAVCVATDNRGSVFVATGRFGVQRSWQPERIDAQPLTVVSCSPMGRCVVGDDDGRVVVGMRRQ